ncbi:prolyl oligopeptidase family [Cryptosporidium sp. chipmunk genotype I]|uniref:prolyl oligopeptidase family n=1 Tax=Cryptosporidium sp. chipmunk genotype I TaxID=1280935 RepID=UPI00351A85D9|nr:prolyl oligopeptidase family [Cryptosporidium sp. chipmunk genotype I]
MSASEVKDTRLSMITAFHGCWVCKEATITKVGSQILSFCSGYRSIGERRVLFNFTLSHNTSGQVHDIDGPLDDRSHPGTAGYPLFEFYKSNYFFSLYEDIDYETKQTIGARMVVYSLNASSLTPFSAASNFDTCTNLIHDKILKVEPDGSFDVGLTWKNAYYIAEPKIKRPKWTDKMKVPSSTKQWEVSDYGNQNLYVPDWGEGLSEFKNPRVYAWSFDMPNSINSEPFELDFSFRETHSVFSLRLLPNEMAMVVNAFENEPLKLGYSYCIARPSKAILCNLAPSEPIGSYNLVTISEIVLSPPDEFVRGIQIIVTSSDPIAAKCTLLYFSISSNHLNLPHWSSLQLCAQDLVLNGLSWSPEGDRRICVSTQAEPAPANDPLKFEGFSGLFGSSKYVLIPLNGSNWVFTSTFLGNKVVPVAVNISTRQVCRIKLVVSDESLYEGDLEVLSVSFGPDKSSVYATLNLASPIMPSLVMIVQMCLNPVRNIIHAQIIKSVSSFGRNSNAFAASLVPRTPESPLFNNTFRLAKVLDNIEFFTFKEKHLVIRSKDLSKCYPGLEKSPLLLFLHGGPHSIITTNYNHFLTFLVSIGYTILAPNYTGSIGFGDNYTKSLIGRCFEADVDEIMCLSDKIRSIQELNLDPKKCFAFGGSYGGALIFSLIANYPKFLTCAASSNGFSNAISFIGMTDIPDYVFSELITETSELEKNRITILRNRETLIKLHAKSPISMVDKVITPLLIAVGGKDKRVPAAQSIEFYRALKQLGKSDVKMLYYPDSGHSISRSNEPFDLFLNIASWFGLHSGIPFVFNGDL